MPPRRSCRRGSRNGRGDVLDIRFVVTRRPRHRRKLPRLAELDLIVFDFDGVMTNNRVYVFEDGREAVQCNRADGLGCDILHQAGARMMILSTEVNDIVVARAKKLKIEVFGNVADKAAALARVIQERRLDPVRIMYVGNDVNDLAAMEIVGWPVAPADAHPAIRAIARYTTEAVGGSGVVRELADLIAGVAGTKKRRRRHDG